MALSTRSRPRADRATSRSRRLPCIATVQGKPSTAQAMGQWVRRMVRVDERTDQYDLIRHWASRETHDHHEESLAERERTR